MSEGEKVKMWVICICATSLGMLKQMEQHNWSGFLLRKVVA